MYRVDYYTLAICEDGSIGNIKQYSDTWYTDFEISVIEGNLKIVIANRKGLNKYYPVITCIEKIKGHF